MLDDLSNDRLLVTIDEPAKIIATSRDTIYRMIRNGEIRTVRLGTRQRIRIDDLRSWVEAHTFTAGIGTQDENS